jgi:putative aldouronate transport system permease protein
MAHLVGLWPKGFNLSNYQQALKMAAFTHSFLISVFRVILGTTTNVAVCVMAAYPLAVRERLPGREVIKWIMVFGMVVYSGLIPWYLTLRALGLLDSMAGLVLPWVTDVFFILLIANAFREIPVELAEAAQIDGASHWAILFKVYIPLSTSVLAAIALWSAVGHWNSWFDALVIMKDSNKYPLQTFLQTTMVGQSAMAMSFLRDPKISALVSLRSFRAAQIVLASIPIIALYPFLQRYFITGIRLGGVKG